MTSRATARKRRVKADDEVSAITTAPGLEQYRFSGHETFACRFAWMPKVYDLVKRAPQAWSDDDLAMIEMGLGKNMVRSAKFWASAMGLVSGRSSKDVAATAFGERIFGQGGFDPYIEHSATPWLLHWKLSSNPAIPLFAWHFLLNRWPYPEFSRQDVLRVFARESARLGHDHSEITLSQHLDAFLHTYLPSRSAVSIEDSLDGPLTDLTLLQTVGERRTEGARRELIYSFRRGRKPEISAALFNFVVDDYWRTRRPREATISLRELSVGDFSPGRIFLLNEEDIRLRLEAGRDEERGFEYLPSAIDGRIVRQPLSTKKQPDPLRSIYGAGQ
jgi:hypothetical protein